ncbi:aminotransferase class IV [uncultured Umboniibacter sp.]|uniref:aminotransferase class IV n=1 Tax=uncultured Umboniibacter sp. TaxID=1798917 RepID=UPI002611248F|nr:aminotransferase class IV [uncultured Umboniibacter sp.]
MTKFWIDGVENGAIPYDNRSLMYGEGVFETLRIVDGSIPLLAAHWRRVRRAAAQLGIAISIESAEGFLQSIDLSSLRWLRLQWSPCSAGRGYGARNNTAQCQLLAWGGTDLTNAPGLVKLVSLTTRLSPRTFSSGLKMVSAADYSAAASELDKLAQHQHLADGLLLNAEGNVIETTRSNVFFLGSEGIVTPCLKEYGVSGVMRSVVIDLAKAKDWPLSIRPVNQQELGSFHSAYLSNALMGCIPVAQIDEYRYQSNNRYDLQSLTRELGFNND